MWRKKFVHHINEMLLGLVFNTKKWHSPYRSEKYTVKYH